LTGRPPSPRVILSWDSVEYAVIRVCAWCSVFLGVKAPLQDWRVTHGICERCRAHVESGHQMVPPPPGALLILAHRPPLGFEPPRLPPEVLAVRPVVRLDRRGAGVTRPSAYRGLDRRSRRSDFLRCGWMLVRPVPDCSLCFEPIEWGNGCVAAGRWAHFVCAARTREPMRRKLLARSADALAQAKLAVEEARHLRLAVRRLRTAKVLELATPPRPATVRPTAKPPAVQRAS